jgi:hypothetical protein
VGGGDTKNSEDKISEITNAQVYEEWNGDRQDVFVL